MGHAGIGEIVLILAVLVIVFGAGRLPQLGDSLGRAIRSFKRSASENDLIEVRPKDEGRRDPRSTGAASDAEVVRQTAPSGGAESAHDATRGDAPQSK
jgi:sec-independent protein translocase protein TatA